MYCISPWQMGRRAEAVCINKKQMLLALPAVLFSCSIQGRIQLKKHKCAVTQAFSLQIAVTLINSLLTFPPQYFHLQG